MNNELSDFSDLIASIAWCIGVIFGLAFVGACTLLIFQIVTA